MIAYVNILLIFVLLLTVGMIGLWQYVSRGSWYYYPIGQAFMGLLLSHTLVFGVATAVAYWPDFPGQNFLWIITAGLLVIAKIRVAWVIWSLRKGPEDTT